MRPYRKNEANKVRQKLLIDRLRALLLKNPMSQSSLGLAMGIPRLTVSYFLDDSRATSMKTLDRIESWIIDREKELGLIK